MKVALSFLMMLMLASCITASHTCKNSNCPIHNKCKHELTDAVKNDVIDLFAGFIDRIDEIHINNFAEQWPLDRYTAAITDAFSYMSVNGNFTILPNSGPALSIVGRQNLINTYIAVIRKINGGENRYTHRFYVKCIAPNKYQLTAIGGAFSQPLVNGVRTGIMNVIPNKFYVIVSKSHAGKLSIDLIVSDQRGGYKVADMALPWAPIRTGRYYN